MANSITFGILLPFSGRFTPPEFALGLAGLQFPSNTSHVFLSLKGPNRALNRINLVKSAIKHSCKYVLFIDDDVMVPMDTMKRLFMALETADDDVIAAGGVYCSKSIPAEPFVYLQEDGGPHWKWRAGDIFPCQGIGTGCLMIKTSSFAKIPEPWFRDIDSVEEIGDDPALSIPDHYHFRMTDDLYWCRKVEQAGLKILAHGGVLPVHWDQQGNPFTLPRDSYPMQAIESDPWYAGFAVIDKNLVNPERYIELPEGFLAQQEANELHSLARDKRVLEMGAFRGRSTVCMAMTAREVVSVDWHQGDIHVDKVSAEESSLSAYLKNIRNYSNVTPIVGRFEDEIPKLAGQQFDLIFVDGQHDRASVIRDMQMALSFRPPVIAVHDYGLFEVTEALQEMGMTPGRVIETLAIFEFPENIQAAA